MAFLALGAMVVMGILAGGMGALAMIGPRRHQNIYGILALFGLVAAIIGALLGQAVNPTPLLSAILNYLLNLVLSGFIGYAVTTFFVLSYQSKPDIVIPDRATIQAAQNSNNAKIGVIYFTPVESEEYNVRVAARGLDTTDYPHALPPTLLRPLALLELKRKYATIGRDPARSIHFRLAQKVQDRLGRRYKVYIAFYNDHPMLDEAVGQAIREGATRLIVLHPRLTNAPAAIKPEDLLDAFHLKRYGISLVETATLWNSDLLPRLFVRRVRAAVEDQPNESVGVLLIGQGHPQPRRARSDSSTEPSSLQRQNQELAFQKRVRQALIRAGFADDKIVLTWLHWQHPTIPSASAQLVTEGCKRIYWIASGFLSEGVATLQDIPALLREAQTLGGVETVALGPWNDDDIVAEVLTERVKQVANAGEPPA